MSAGLMLQLRDAWVIEFGKLLPELSARSYPGRFNVKELEAVMLEAPAVLVACMGSEDLNEVGDGQIDVKARYVAYVLVADMDGLERDAAGLNITEGLLLRLLEGGELVSCSADVIASDIEGVTNLYSGDFREQGVGLWAVSWKQILRLGSNEFLSEGTVPRTGYVGYAPKIGRPHEDEYQKLETGDAGI